MNTPDFNDLTPPDELMRDWCDGWPQAASPLRAAARWGARHGYEQARQLWPEPITDRPPTDADGDDEGLVQCLRHDGCWSLRTAKTAADHKSPWLHTPRWQPRPPSLKERAREQLKRHDMYGEPLDTNLILSALEQAGEGVEHE
jgi:hypothetical protein